MIINLYSSFYIDDNPERQAELNQSLQFNINNPLINKIYLFLEYPIDSELVDHSKVKYYFIKKRPYYNTFFDLINKTTGNDDWNIISNSDIYFDDTLSYLHRYNSTVVLALTRWDVNGHNISFLNRRDSQDSWFIKGKVKDINGDFGLGKAGCDNAIADRFSKVGYNISNPSKTIKSYHLHNSGIRSYIPSDRAPQPYLLLNPTI